MKKYMACVLVIASVGLSVGCSESETENECASNVRKCVDGHVVRCSSGKWKETKQRCDLDSKSCISGLRKCEGDVLKTCKLGSWEVFEDCAESGKACDPDAVSCIACSGEEKACFGQIIKQCRDGAWEFVEECGGDTPICQRDIVQCQACADGEYDCGIRELFKCEQGEWQSVETCTEGYCDIVTQSCRVCIDDQLRCSGDVLQVCEAGTWKDSVDCGAKKQQCDPLEGICRDMSCEIGDMKCVQLKWDAFVYTCPDGVWTLTTECRFGTCAKNQKQCSDAKCELGERKCQKNTSTGDMLMECDGYEFQPLEMCPISCVSPETMQPHCAACEFQKTKCQDGAISWCNLADSWEQVKVCASGTCQDGTKCPEDECQYLDKKCVDGKQYNCAPLDGVMTWRYNIDCVNGCFTDGKSCLNCPPGERRCWGDNVVECVNNDWREVKTCGAGLCSNGACRECDGGDWKCDIRTATSMVCENGKWVRTRCESGYCEDEYACLDARCGIPASRKCVNNKELLCSNDYKWVVRRSCVCVNGNCED